MSVNGSHNLRPHDWPQRLAQYIAQHRATPFQWGAHDCVTFALGWLDCVREDLDPQLEALRASLRYRTAGGALRRMDGRSLEVAVDEWNELEPVDVALAHRGDLMLIEVNGRQSLGVCVGEHVAGPGVTGLELVPRTAAVAAWRV